MLASRICLVVALLIGSAGCAGDQGVAPLPEEAIRIGGFNFAESELLAEIYAQVLESRGLPVARLGPVGPREVVEPALELGLIDVVPEYAGTMLEFVNLGAGEATAETAETVTRLRRWLEPRGLVALEPAAAQDSNAFVIHQGSAGTEGVHSVSDLAPIATELAFGGPPECPERYFCLAGLADVYGIEFGSFTPVPFGVIPAALRSAEIDVGLLFSTDPELSDPDLVMLVDDKGLQPAENVIPVVRADAVDRWGPQLVVALNSVSDELDTAGLAALNAAYLEADQHEPGALAGVVEDWLAGHRING